MKQMKFPFFAALFFAYSSSNAQDVPIVLSKDYKLSIGVNFSPDMCFRKLINTDNSSMSSSIISSRNNLESPLFGFSTGLNVGYKFANRFSFSGGLQYSVKGYEIKDIHFTTIDDPEGKNHLGKILYNFNYVDVPLKINYMFGRKKLHFIGGIGVVANFLIKESVISVIKSNSNRSQRSSNTGSDNFYHFNLSPTASVGVEYNLNDRIFARVEPNFQMCILRVIDAPVSERLYSYGVNMSIHYRL